MGNKICICPLCNSSDIEFMVWANPNDIEIKATDCQQDEAFDGWCKNCKENIKSYDINEISVESK